MNPMNYSLFLFLSFTACDSSREPSALSEKTFDEDKPPARTIQKANQSPLVGSTLLTACQKQSEGEWQDRFRETYGNNFKLLCNVVGSAPEAVVLGRTCGAFAVNDIDCNNESLALSLGLNQALVLDMGKNRGAISKGIALKNDAFRSRLKHECVSDNVEQKIECLLALSQAFFQTLWNAYQILHEIDKTVCDNGAFHVALDAGHAIDTPGVRSARGLLEYNFNRSLASLVGDELQNRGMKATFINPSGGPFTLTQRKQEALVLEADLLLSLHHDSVQPQLLSEWDFGGRKEKYCDLHRGFSFFYSQSSSNPEKSIALAKEMGRLLLLAGFSPTLHHAEDIEGERRELVNEGIGLYRRDSLGVLKGTSMTSLLFEAGVIVHREEEKELSDPLKKAIMAVALAEGVSSYCLSAK